MSQVFHPMRFARNVPFPLNATNLRGATLSPALLRRTTPVARPTERVVVSRPEGEKAEEQLPRPNPGEPIQAAHFRTIADSIEGLRGALELANALVGRSLDAAVAAVETAGRSVQRIVSTAGIHHDPANIGAIGDRVVLHATPTDAGGLEVNLIVAEPATSAKVVPNLVGLTYGEAVRLMRRTLGDAHPGIAPVAPDLRGQTLDRLDR